MPASNATTRKRSRPETHEENRPASTTQLVARCPLPSKKSRSHRQIEFCLPRSRRLPSRCQGTRCRAASTQFGEPDRHKWVAALGTRTAFVAPHRRPPIPVSSAAWFPAYARKPRPQMRPPDQIFEKGHASLPRLAEPRSSCRPAALRARRRQVLPKVLRQSVTRDQVSRLIVAFHIVKT